MNRILIILGIIFIVLGLLWPILAKSGLGRLPGDFSFRRGGFTFYFPLASCILLSLLCSIALWFFRK